MTALSVWRGARAAADRRSHARKEILHPLAVTIFGGLISATLLDAFLTPVLFRKFGRSRSSACGCCGPRAALLPPLHPLNRTNLQGKESR